MAETQGEPYCAKMQGKMQRRMRGGGRCQKNKEIDKKQFLQTEIGTVQTKKNDCIRIME